MIAETRPPGISYPCVGAIFFPSPFSLLINFSKSQRYANSQRFPPTVAAVTMTTTTTMTTLTRYRSLAIFPWRIPARGCYVSREAINSPVAGRFSIARRGKRISFDSREEGIFSFSATAIYARFESRKTRPIAIARHDGTYLERSCSCYDRPFGSVTSSSLKKRKEKENLTVRRNRRGVIFSIRSSGETLAKKRRRGGGESGVSTRR